MPLKYLNHQIQDRNVAEMTFKEVYCRDCSTVLARYNLKYFSESKIAELTRLHHQAHIKSGHALVTRSSE
jgi:hypothetical protein